MADYKIFPFERLTTAEIFLLARDSRNLGDEEFVSACMEAIRLRKPEQGNVAKEMLHHIKGIAEKIGNGASVTFSYGKSTRTQPSISFQADWPNGIHFRSEWTAEEIENRPQDVAEFVIYEAQKAFQHYRRPKAPEQTSSNW